MATRKWLEADLNNSYLPLLSRLSDSPQGRKRARQLWGEMRDDWALGHGLKEDMQQVGCLNQVRRAIKDVLGLDHWSLEIVDFSSEVYTAINEKKQARVALRNEGVKYLEKPDEIVARAVRLLESREWARIAAGLAVLTGRRVSELLATAQFEKKTQWSVVFRGAVKRGSEQGLAFEVPTLTTADRVIGALATIRRELPQAVGMSPQQLNRSFEPAVARVCDEVFWDLVPTREGEANLYTHLFRAIYATIATLWYCPPWVNAEEFKAAIQGHFKLLDAENPSLRRSIAAGRHYADYEVADAPRRGVKLGRAGVQVIELFQRDEGVENEGVEVAVSTKRTVRLVPSSVRVWRQDKDKLESIFDRLGLDAQGKQEDRMRGLLDWALVALNEAPVQAETEVTVPSPTPTPDPLRADIQELVGALKAFTSALPGMLNPPSPAPTPRAVAPATDQQGSGGRSLSNLAKPTGERKIKSKAQTAQTLDFLLKAIMDWNDHPDRTHDQKWHINFSVLRRWVKSKPAIESFLAEQREAIDAHHAKHGIQDNHNYRHRGKISIQDIIQLAH